MKNVDNVHSERYYIFKHDPTKPDIDTVKYRESTGSWSFDFDRAMLWADYDFTVKKAKELARQLHSCVATKNYKVVIGQVKIEVSGQFPLVLIEA